MPKKLVSPDGSIDFGLYDEAVGEVNYLDYDLETPMGLPVPRHLRKMLGKQFHFTGILGPEVLIGLAVIDLKYLGSAFAYVYDRRSGRMTETRKLQPAARQVSIETSPDSGLSRFSVPGLSLQLGAGRAVAVGEGFEFSLDMSPPEVDPLRICTRAGYRGWVYTQKTAPMRVSGSLLLNGERLEIDSPKYMALSDWTCGFMRRETFWNWAATAATLPGGRSLGLNLSCGVNETSYTENAFWLDAAMTKVDTVSFHFDPKDPMKPWQVRSRDGKVDLRFQPEAERSEKIAAVLISSRFSQLAGSFEGRLVTKEGEEVLLEGCPGFVEDHYAKW